MNSTPDGWKVLKFWNNNYQQVLDKIAEREKTTLVLPFEEQRLRALQLVPLNKVKVVILGQDPYHRPGQADGLAFSVASTYPGIPRSLSNIFSELRTDIGCPKPRTGELSQWAQEGVLLLNTILTVEEGKPLSHKGIGWEILTYEVIAKLSAMSRGIVFILWGRQAKEYQGAINRDKHLVITSPHPSPYSANMGFFGSRPFSRANAYLRTVGKEEVRWRLR